MPKRVKELSDISIKRLRHTVAIGEWSEKTHIELSKAEEPEDRHWNVEIVS